MFDHVVLRRAEAGTPITAGQIAEALLFYQKVHLVIDRQTLFALVRQIGASGLLSLVARTDFSAVYTEEVLGTRTNSVGASQYYDFVAFTLTGTDAGGELKTPTDRLRHDLEQNGLTRAESKNIAEAFLRKVPVRKLSGNHFVKGGIPEAASSELRNTEYLNNAFSEIITRTPGGYEPRPSVKVEVTCPH